MQYLSIELLGEAIQRGPHSPVEDCIATVRLLKLHRHHRGPPPPRVVALRLLSARRPCLPLGCSAHRVRVEGDTGEDEEDEAEEDEDGTDEEDELNGDDVPQAGRANDNVTGPCPAEPDSAEPIEWTIRLVWSTDHLRDLLDWWCDESSSSSPTHDSQSLAFPPSLPKEHRAVLHKEAKKLGLSTWSRGIGAARSIRVLPMGVSAPEPSERTKRVASLVYRWSRKAAEEDGEEAMEAPYSLGEVEELVEWAEGIDGTGSHREAEVGVPCELLPPADAGVDVPALISRAIGALCTVPEHTPGQELAWRSSHAYMLSLVLQGRAEDLGPDRRRASAAHHQGGRRGRWNNKNKR